MTQPSSATRHNLVLSLFGLSVGLNLLAACTGQVGVINSSANSKAALGQPHAIHPAMKEKHTLLACASKGGTWKAPTFGKRLSGAVGYGANTCTRGYRIGTWSYFEDPQGWPTPSGYTVSFVVCYYMAAFSFDGSGIDGSVSGSYLQTSKPYVLSIYSYTDSAYTLISQQTIGLPTKGQLAFTSPFQGGFTSDANGEFCFVFAFPSN